MCRHVTTSLADIIILGLAAAAGITVPFLILSSGDRFTTVLVIISATAAAIGMNHTIPRRPKLTVEYQNPDADNKPVAWPEAAGRSCELVVVVVNEGRGSAEAFEVEFESAGGLLYNPSGNMPDRRYLDQTVHPPRFISGERVLAPNQELRIAKFSPATPRTVSWQARAKHMREQQGTIEILESEPPRDRTSQ